eukprot:878737-Prymnesium_polylepis.1
MRSEHSTICAGARLDSRGATGHAMLSTSISATVGALFESWSCTASGQTGFGRKAYRIFWLRFRAQPNLRIGGGLCPAWQQPVKGVQQGSCCTQS